MSLYYLTRPEHAYWGPPFLRGCTAMEIKIKIIRQNPGAHTHTHTHTQTHFCLFVICGNWTRKCIPGTTISGGWTAQKKKKRKISGTILKDTHTQTRTRWKPFIKCIWHVGCHTYPNYELWLKTLLLRHSYTGLVYNEQIVIHRVIHAHWSTDSYICLSGLVYSDVKRSIIFAILKVFVLFC